MVTVMMASASQKTAIFVLVAVRTSNLKPRPVYVLYQELLVSLLQAGCTPRVQIERCSFVWFLSAKHTPPLLNPQQNFGDGNATCTAQGLSQASTWTVSRGPAVGGLGTDVVMKIWHRGREERMVRRKKRRQKEWKAKRKLGTNK
jgi:hypothetical protein